LQPVSARGPGMIITDDVARKPVLDFDAYSDTVVDIIKNSYPRFSIGIYGEWGTGKTTLMRQIESKLKTEKSITTVWFNAWRYEREEQFALIPLLKKIAYSLPDKKEYEGLRKSIKKGIGTIRRNMPQIVTSIVSDFVKQGIGENTENVVKAISNQLIPKIELLTEVNEKDTIYFDGLDNIEEEIIAIREKGQPIRIVVFIDDLDRCSPKKALEVFESVKVFLGVDGFIYIIGLSYETISKLITAEYGKSDIKGDQYIKKIIQIPITLPEWSHDDVSKLINDFIKRGILNKKYLKIIKTNKDLIAKAVENNPRETKRFINNFIVAHEIHSRYKKVDAAELLLVQAINVRWNSFYRIIVKLDTVSRNELKSYVEMSELDRNKELDIDTSEKNLSLEMKRLLRQFKTDAELWSFLKHHSDLVFGITDWETYRRATESVGEFRNDRASQLASTYANIIETLIDISGEIAEIRILSREANLENEIDIFLTIESKLKKLIHDLQNFKQPTITLRQSLPVMDEILLTIETAAKGIENRKLPEDKKMILIQHMRGKYMEISRLKDDANFLIRADVSRQAKTD